MTTDAPIPLDDEDEALAPEASAESDGARLIEIVLEPEDAGVRLDKVLAERAEGLSRARLQALMEAGAVTRDGVAITGGSAKAQPGLYLIAVPAPASAEPLPETIPLQVLYEDAHLIVLNKPAGMAVHPAPGSEAGTLVNALLHHCAGSLAGIGGVSRPGIVHRLDKDTSGVMVAAKTDAAHAGLSALFAAHDIDRLYVALVRGAPHPARGTVETRIGRSAHDRKKMAVLKSGDARRSPTTGWSRPMARPTSPWPRASPAGWRPAARTRSASTWRSGTRRCWAIRSMARASRPKPWPTPSKPPA